MALMKEGLWNIVDGIEAAPGRDIQMHLHLLTVVLSLHERHFDVFGTFLKFEIVYAFFQTSLSMLVQLGQMFKFVLVSGQNNFCLGVML